MFRILAIILTFLMTVAVPATAQEFSPDQKKAMEQVIRDYLIANPAVIREALEALQAQEQAARRQRMADAVKNRRGELFDDPASPVGGNPEGDITIVEFFDYNCGYCKQVSPTVSALLQADKNIRVVYKEFAILGPQSVEAAKAALAAGRQGKYHEFHKEMMEAGQADMASATAAARKLGLDIEKLRADMNAPEIDAALEKNVRLAQAIGINGTPAFVIGDQVVPGAIEPEQFAAIIAAERAKKKAGKTKK